MGVDLVGLLRGWAQWNSVIIGVLTVCGFFIHFFNPERTGITPCVADTDVLQAAVGQANEVNLGAVSCIGNALRWSQGATTGGVPKNPVGDINAPWRKTFTFSPDDFCDLWTPLFLGALQILMHFGPSTRFWQGVTESWLLSCVFGAIASLWAQFGYAGNFGVFLGFYTLCAWCPFCLVLQFLDKDVGRLLTVLDLGKVIFGKRESVPDESEDGLENDKTAEEQPTPAEVGNEA